jgi:hypothetical protein
VCPPDKTGGVGSGARAWGWMGDCLIGAFKRAAGLGWVSWKWDPNRFCVRSVGARLVVCRSAHRVRSVAAWRGHATMRARRKEGIWLGSGHRGMCAHRSSDTIRGRVED